MQPYNNGLDDQFGIVSVQGSHNSILSNHFSVNPDSVVPADENLVVGHITSGSDNLIATNHIATPLNVYSVLVEEGIKGNTVLDSGTSAQVSMDLTLNAFRPTPAIA